jgi:hypothetical protein
MGAGLGRRDEDRLDLRGYLFLPNVVAERAGYSLLGLEFAPHLPEQVFRITARETVILTVSFGARPAVLDRLV